jgi:divalent metal cation (Fe/Co/Zn/Cd) transporter
MLAVLVVTGVIPVVLGRKKLPLGVELHDKALYADAHMNRADWLTALAGIVGVIGIAFGLWWADAVAAGFISLEIARDGAKHLWRVTLELMDRAPTLVERNTTEPIASKVVQELEKLDWVRQADVRLREEGHVFTGEAFVVPVDDKELTERIRKAGELIRAIDWRIFDLVVTPVAELGPPPPGAAH